MALTKDIQIAQRQETASTATSKARVLEVSWQPVESGPQTVGAATGFDPERAGRRAVRRHAEALRRLSH